MTFGARSAPAGAGDEGRVSMSEMSVILRKARRRAEVHKQRLDYGIWKRRDAEYRELMAHVHHKAKLMEWHRFADQERAFIGAEFLAERPPRYS